MLRLMPYPDGTSQSKLLEQRGVDGISGDDTSTTTLRDSLASDEALNDILRARARGIVERTLMADMRFVFHRCHISRIAREPTPPERP
jgi:hypothetical protein